MAMVTNIFGTFWLDYMPFESMDAPTTVQRMKNELVKEFR